MNKLVTDTLYYLMLFGMIIGFGVWNVNMIMKLNRAFNSHSNVDYYFHQGC